MTTRTAFVLLILSLGSVAMSSYFTSSKNLASPRLVSSSVPEALPPIVAGDALPEIEVLKWVQGEPVDFHHFGSKLTVIDVWSDW